MRKRKTPLSEQERSGVSIEEKVFNQLKGESDNASGNCTSKRKFPIVPMLLGYVIGSLFGKILLVILKIAGVL